jgi:CHAD domain-containing protein
MPSFVKWLKRLPARATVREAAQRALAERLRALAHFLRQARKENRPRAETIHQLRVWSRRTSAAVRYFQTTEVETPALRRLRKKVKKVRRWAGPIRDLDVLAQRLKSLRPAVDAAVTKQVATVRDEARKEWAALVRRKRILRDGQGAWTKLGTAACRSLGKAGKASFRDFARAALRASSERFLAVGALDLATSENLHAFRIAGKELRYTLELALTACPRKRLDNVYSQLSTLQDTLGSICDRQVALGQYQALQDAVATSGGKQSLRRVAHREQQALARETAAFVRSWTTRRQNAWRKMLESLAAPQDKRT